MENLIREAFLHVDVIGPRVADGHYDLIGPQGDIILPQEWESVVEPGWMITMHMWPIPEPAPSEAPPFEEDDESVVVPDASSAHAGVSLSPPEASSDPSAPFGEAAVSGGGTSLIIEFFFLLTFQQASPKKRNRPSHQRTQPGWQESQSYQKSLRRLRRHSELLKSHLA